MCRLFYVFNLIFICLLFSSNKLRAQTHPENTKFKHLTVDDGLSDNSVSAILQDREGFIWLGTADGLNKYDGYKFTIYRHIPSDSNSIGPGSIGCIYEDKEGRIWIGAEGSLSILDKKTGKFKVYKNDPKNRNSLSNNIVNDIIEDKEGNMWISTYGGGLNKFDKKSDNFLVYKNDPENSNCISSDYVQNCIEDSNGIIWIATFQREGNKGGLNSLDKLSGEFTYYERDQFDFEKNRYEKTNGISDLIWRIIEDTKGIIWIGNGSTEHGLVAFDKEKKTVINQFIRDPKDKRSLSNNIVMCLYDDGKGHLWAGTISGLNILDKNTGKLTIFKNDPNDPNSLSNNYITEIYEDNQGLIWICTGAGGVNIYDRNNNNFIVFKNNPKNEKSLTNNLVYSIYEDSKGIIWMGTGAGGLTNFDKSVGEFNYFNGEIMNNGKKIKVGIIGSIQEGNEEQLWLGIPSLNVLGFDLIKRKYNYAPNFVNGKGENSSEFIFSLLVDSEKSLWLATPIGLYNNNFSVKKRIHYVNDPKNLNSISENFTFNIFEDFQNNIWVSTRSTGLNVFERSSGKFYCFKNNPKDTNTINNDVVNTIYQAPNGVLWLGTNGGGLNALVLPKGKPQFTAGYKFYHFTDKDGLPNNVISGIVPDNTGNLWISTNQGVSRFTPPEYLSSSTLNYALGTSKEVIKNDEPVFKNYDLSDGLPSNSIGAAYKSKDGLLYFGSTDGLLCFNPDSLKDNAHQPPVYFTSFKVFEKEFPLDTTVATKREIILSYQQNFFSFEFVALDYAQPVKNQYAFMMEGFDSKWIYSGNRRYASYTNLDPGAYIFRVKASNNNGLWNEDGASIRIMITPPFWRTNTFYTFCLLTIIIIVFAYIKWRERNLIREKRILEDKVELRTKQLDEKNKIVEEQKNVVIEKNLQITESINYARQIQNAILPSKEFIKTFSPDSFIFFRPKDIVSGDFYYFREFEKYTLLACVDCTGHGVPGGFMSTLGSLLLDKIANDETLSPSEILSKLSDEIIRVLHQQDGGEIQDGMDLSICLIDRHNRKIEFSGARNGIIVITNNEAKRYKADPLPVGGNYMKKGIAIERNFKTQSISINPNDWIYMYTDGFMEQTGGKENIPMNYMQFENHLINLSKKQNPDEKNRLLQSELDNWRGIHERDDDVLIMGFQVG